MQNIMHTFRDSETNILSLGIYECYLFILYIFGILGMTYSFCLIINVVFSKYGAI